MQYTVVWLERERETDFLIALDVWLDLTNSLMKIVKIFFFLLLKMQVYSWRSYMYAPDTTEYSVIANNYTAAMCMHT